MRIRDIAESIAALPRIVAVRFVEGRPMSSVIVQYDNGDTNTLFQYNQSEINFTPHELIGLTGKEAKYLKDKKLDDYIGFSQF